MITYIKGKFTEKTPAYLVMETAGGMGYMIHISLNTYSEIKDLEEGLILTHFVVKEDAQLLYGFHTPDERLIFRHLITVNGIGSNTAILLLSSLSIHEIIHAITNEDVRVLQSVKGIGGKTAQRIIIDLKDKIGKAQLSDLPETKTANFNQNKFEASQALVSLGFSKVVCDSVIDKILKTEGATLSVEELIKKALKAM
jgi:Holliday junction DNA helicase RuvA